MSSVLLSLATQEGLVSKTTQDGMVQRNVLQEPKLTMTIRVIPNDRPAAELGPLTVTVEARETPEWFGLPPDSTRTELFEKVKAALKASL